MWHLLCVTR
uniref:Uncharacterized protein n=1 Tax=Anguilla anguilla TaxID=7936 RepID=A0A0E9UW70_ANGAN